MSNIDERNTDYNTSGRLEDDKIDIIAILLDMWKGVRKFWLLLLIIAIVCAGIFFAYNKLTYTPLYRAYATFSVGGDADSDNGYASIDAEELKETLPYILQSQVLQDMIMDDLQLDWFNFDLSLSSQENVALYTLTVSGDNAQDVYNVLNNIDLKKFDKIYDETYSDTLKYILCKCSNLNDIDDIIQETYLELYKVLKDQKEILNYKSYILAIARNKIIKYFDSNKKLNTVSIFQEDDEEEYTIDLDSRYRYRVRLYYKR